MNFAGFDRPKVCKKKILCLYSPSLKVHGTKTSGPLRFSELVEVVYCFFLIDFQTMVLQTIPLQEDRGGRVF